MNKILKTLILLVLILGLASPVSAEGDASGDPVYIVKAGDTLWTIARNLHISYAEMLAVNGLTENSSIIPGTELVIPGLNGSGGIVSTVNVDFGENLQSISRRFQVPEDKLVRINRLTSPFELYSGVSAVLLGEEEPVALEGKRISLMPEESSLELAVKQGMNPWTVILNNGQDGSWDLLPGEVFLVPGSDDEGPGAFPADVHRIRITPDDFIQGHTYVIKVNAPDGTEISGAFGDYPLHFFTENGNAYLALQGLHAKETPGLKSLSISGTLPDGTPFAHTQMVEIFSGNYHYEDILGVPQATVGVEITEDETEQLEVYTKVASGEKFWDGYFLSPVPPELEGAYASYFGGRRSYNGSGYFYFHSGLDYFSLMGGDIYATAPGEVIFTGSLLLHGNTTLIDHGWGVYSLYAHQSEFLVQKGQKVQAGALIGRVGSTGRSTGPHFHWEIWVGGIQVDPLDWLETSYP